MILSRFRQGRDSSISLTFLAVVMSMLFSTSTRSLSIAIDLLMKSLATPASSSSLIWLMSWVVREVVVVVMILTLLSVRVVRVV